MATDFDGSHLGWAARMGDALVGVQTTIDSWRFSPRAIIGWVLATAACVGGLWLVFGGDDPASVESQLPRVGAAAAVRTGAVPGADPEPSSGASGIIEPAGELVVYVIGAVAEPGVVQVPPGSRAQDAVEAAGGLTLVADPERMNLAAKVVDGQRIVVPVRGEMPPPVVDGSGGAASGDGAASSSPSPQSPLDLNSATEAQLDALPGVGPATAAAIVAYRDQHGAFRSVDSLANVRGIGPAKLDQIRPLVNL